MEMLLLLPPLDSKGVKSASDRTRSLACAALVVALHVVGAAQAQTLLTAVDPAVYPAVDPAVVPAVVPVRETAAGAPVPAAGEILYLFQRIALAHSARSATISIDFTPSAWRVGSPEGPAATLAQVKSVFGQLQPVIVAGRCLQVADGAALRPCAVALGRPDFAGIFNPELPGEVFGWVATAPSTKLGGGDTASTAMRYFGLLSPMHYAGRASPGALVALRYREAASMQLPHGLAPSAASLIIHNDRLPVVTGRTPAACEALARRVAGR